MSTPPTNPTDEPAASPWIVLALGLFFAALSTVDLVGDDPDSGLFDLGPQGTAYLLRAFAAVLVVAGVLALVRRRRRDARG
jgi:hypothetical protein